MTALPRTMSRTDIGRLAAFLVLLGALLLSAALAVMPLLDKHAELAAAEATMAKMERHVALNKGEQGPSLKAEDHLIVAASVALAEADLQRDIAADIVRAGGVVLQSETVPVDADADAGQITVSTEFEIDSLALPQLLHALEVQKPAVFVERLALSAAKTAGGGEADRMLRGTALLSGSWKRSAP